MHSLRKIGSTAAVTGLLLVGGTGCSNSGEDAGGSAEPSASSESATPTSNGTKSSSASPDATEGESTETLTLQEIVALQNETIQPQLEVFKDLFSEIKIEAQEPNGIVYSYTYAFDVDATETANGLEAESESLADTAETIFPAMRDAGIDNPEVNFRYLDTSGKVIWEKTFTAD